MIHTVPVLHLEPAQLDQLIDACQAYRGYLWQAVLPSPERNQDTRIIQGILARLTLARVQAGGTAIRFPVSGEERARLKHLVLTLIRQTNQEPASERRGRVRAELGGLLLLIGRARGKECQED